MLALSTVFASNREDYESYRMPIATFVKPAALFCHGDDFEPTAETCCIVFMRKRSGEIKFKSSDFENVDPSNVGRSLS